MPKQVLDISNSLKSPAERTPSPPSSRRTVINTSSRSDVLATCTLLLLTTNKRPTSSDNLSLLLSLSRISK
ncbi:unnamed protein product [Cunninghamella echinulata]